MSTPLSIPLTRPSGWHSNGNPDGPFDVVRFNFLVKERQLLETGYGEAVDSIVSPTNTPMETRQKVTFEYEQVDSSSIVQEHLSSSQSLATMGADARLGSDKFGSAGFSAAIEECITDSFRTTKTVETARTIRISREEEVTVSTTGGNERAVHAAPYRRHEMAVRLSHVDYLIVKYESTHAGLRVRRIKHPALNRDQDVSHRNWVQSGLLLGTYRFWVREGDASKSVVSVSEHEANHINPGHVSFTPAKSESRRFYGLSPFKGTPSLYKISNAAFPLKDRQRRSSWTEEDLLMVPDWEEQDTAWCWENLRRQRRQAWRLAGPGE